jgi:hypothetical protein
MVPFLQVHAKITYIIKNGENMMHNGNRRFTNANQSDGVPEVVSRTHFKHHEQ